VRVARGALIQSIVNGTTTTERRTTTTTTTSNHVDGDVHDADEL
jgi:hypothetical protein